MVAAAEKFLAKHLGGRYQESVSPEVAKRLKEITVDPKTVKLAVKTDMAAKPSVDVTGKWNVTANVGGQEIAIVLNLKQVEAALNGSMTSPLGVGTVENGKVAGKNVMGTIKADVQGQPMELKMEGTVDGDTMTGTLNAAGLPPISFKATKQK
jgi:hypothetical protein